MHSPTAPSSLSMTDIPLEAAKSWFSHFVSSLLPDPAILYTVVDHVPPSRWKEFVRRLGLSDYDIERIELEHRRLRDAQYEMLRLWKLQMGRAATVERISCVLNQMELSGCSEAIQVALLNQNSPQPCSVHSHLWSISALVPLAVTVERGSHLPSFPSLPFPMPPYLSNPP